MSDINDFNRPIVEEFRANGGKVGGPFAGATMLLLTTTGARSGKRRTVPLAWFPDGDRMLIVASKGGAPTNPDWFHNLRAHPEATAEVGTESFPVRATVLEGAERDREFARIVALAPGFGEYQKNTERTIPVVALERAG